MLRVLDVVTQIAAFPVIPDVADHAVIGGERACGQSYVAHDGLGIRVLVMRICEYNTGIQQVLEAAFAETIRIPLNKIASKAVHGDLQHKSDIAIGGCLLSGTRRRDPEQRAQRNQAYSHHCPSAYRGFAPKAAPNST